MNASVGDSRYGIRAYVTIRAPRGAVAQPFVIDDATIGRILKRVTISNSLLSDQPGGTFRLELTPGGQGGAYDEDLAEVIEPRSLVEIAVQRYGPDASDLAVNLPEVLMVGMVDFVDGPADFGKRDPSRRFTLTGRCIAGLLVDHKWYFHNFLAREGLLQELPADLRDFALVRVLDPALRDEQDLRALGFLAVDDKLYDLAALDPGTLLERTYQFFIDGYTAPNGEAREPFVKLRFSDNLPLSHRLRFDTNATRANWFDPAAKLMTKFLPTTLPGASGWDIFRYFCERRFVELYAESSGLPNEGIVQIIARKPPWQGRVYYQGGQPWLEYPHGTSPTLGQTLFDPDVVTVPIDGRDLIGRPRLTRGLGAGEAFSLYKMTPAAFRNVGAGQGQIPLDALIPPVLDEFPDSPSYVEKIGLRPMIEQTRYIPVVLDDQKRPRAEADVRSQCIAYEALLREWHFRNPALWFGTFTLKGRTALRVGRRLLDRTRPREYYITGVQHDISLAERASFTSQVTVARGWDVQGGAT